MKQIFTILVALLATTNLWAQSFQYGELYYYITSYEEPYTVEVGGAESSITTVIIPETVTYEGTTYSVTSIGEWAFSNCDALTSVTIGNSVTSIGSSAFSNCTALTSITIPTSVTSIGSQAFGGCSSLPVENNLRYADTYLVEAVDKTLSTYSIKEGTKWIGDYAFAGCDALTSITIPNSVTSIGDRAFRNCSSLTSVAIPNSVTSIGERAFGDCSALTSVTIGNSVTSIGHYAFEYCRSLTSVIIPNSVTSIGWGAFYDCNALTSVTIGNSVTSIEESAFSRCSSLTSITIPNSVTSIGNGAFQYCSALTSIVVESGNSTYDSRENCNAIIETATNTLIAGCQNTIIPNSVTSIRKRAFNSFRSLTSITIPNSVTSIGERTFGDCSALTSVTIGNSVTSIGDAAFGGCRSLTSVTIPNSVTSIGKRAFIQCSNLTSVTIPNSVASIGEWAFAYCSNLKTVICEAIEVPELGDYVFEDMPLSEATLYVPAQSLDDYKAAEQWKEFGTILPIEGESEEEIELQDTEMTIVFTNSEDNDSEIYRQTLTIKVPIAPTIAGFTFLYWQPVAEPITNEITIQAIYEANVPSSAPEVYVNPANPAQKLLRNGQVYILQDGKTYTITGQEL